MTATGPIPNIANTVATAGTSTKTFIEVFQPRDPTQYDNNYQIQQRWWNTVTNNEWILVGFIPTADVIFANWQEVTSGSVTAERFEVDDNTGPGTNPVLPTGLGVVTVTGGQVASGTTTHVIQTNSLAANTYTIQVQRSSAAASSTVGDNGVSHYSSAQFSVDANGFVTLAGGSTAPVLGNTVDVHTGPGTDPVLPNASGIIIITGGQVAAGTTVNAIQTNSLAANTYTIQVQRSQAAASSTVGDNGISHFNSSQFSVDANGFVSLVGGIAISSVKNQVFTYTGSPQTYTPTSGMLYCSIQCLGAGGGGGGAAATSSSQIAVADGGGGGEYAVGIFSASTVGASQTVTIGAAGTAGSSGGGSAGNGGNSSVGSLISSNGGTGGAFGSASSASSGIGGAGGTGGSGGDYRTPGHGGDAAFGLPTPTLLTASGAGADSQLGSGGQSAPTTSSGNVGLGYGSGGGGACNITSAGTPLAGGAGTPGVVIITEYIS